MSKDTSKFPCDFTIKVFGIASNAFQTAVLSIMQQHGPPLAEDAITVRPSENGKYVALSIRVYVESKMQLDNLYHALSHSPQVLMAL